MRVTRINPEYQPKGNYAAASHTHDYTKTLVKGNAETSYRTGNVNLTPSNLGVSDYIVESGTSGNFEYVKYANGWAECRYYGASSSRAVTTKSGNIYYCTLVGITFPFAFVEPPHVTGSLVSSAGNGWVWPQSVTTTGIGGGYIGRGASSTFAAAVSWHIVGRWK